jgi:GNAT superfamily N-acetyltransferase
VTVATDDKMPGPDTVTFQWFPEDNEAHFALPSGAGFANVIDEGTRVWVAEIWVRPEFRSAGLATVLLDAVVTRFGERVIALSPTPFMLSRGGSLPEGDSPGLSAAALASWYGRHGFRRGPRAAPDGPLMARPPGARPRTGPCQGRRVAPRSP